MSNNIDVDVDKLMNFHSELELFREKLSDRLNSLQNSWQYCSSTWKGTAKDNFSPQFEEVLFNSKDANKALEESVNFISDYKEIVEEFEGNR